MCELSWQALKESWEDNFKQAAPVEGVQQQVEQPMEVEEDDRLIGSLIGDDFYSDDVPLNLTASGARVGAQATSPVMDELQEYLAEPVCKDNKDFNKQGVFQYWWDKKDKWPQLTRMWKQFHSAPATSAGVERIFSKAGRNHGDLRKSMEEGTLESALKAGVNSKL